MISTPFYSKCRKGAEPVAREHKFELLMRVVDDAPIPIWRLLPRLAPSRLKSTRREVTLVR